MTDGEIEGPDPGIGLRNVVDALTQAVIVTDADGHILLWSRSAEALYGWSEPEVRGRSVLDVLVPLGEMSANREDLQVVAAGRSMAGDRRVASRDGRVLRVRTHTTPVVDDAGTTLFLVGTSEDVGELRDREQQARDLSEHFASALEAGGLGTWRWTIATGRTVWDERLEALFGLSSGEFDGTFDMYVALLHPDDREETLAVVSQAIEDKSSYRVEHKVAWPDGSVHWLAGAGTVTLDEHGEVTGTVGCSMDVTERVEQELERRRLADLAVVSAANERLQRERLEFLSVVNDALNRSRSVETLMQNVTRVAVPRLGDWCALHVLPTDGSSIPDTEVGHVDPDMITHASELQAQFPYDPEAPTGVPAVIRTGVTEFYSDLSPELLSTMELEERALDVVEELDLRSFIAVALKKRDRILGAIQFVSTGTSRRYDDDDVALAEAIAARIASSIENLRLHAEHRRIARTLQRSLLPERLPDVPGIDIAVRYWAAGDATEVGGDFYDVFTLDQPGQFAIVLGDVCGTGPEAAALTGLARHTVRDSAWHDDPPGAVLRALNRAVRRSGTNTFLTCVYATLEPGTKTMSVTCAGHPLPVHVSARGAEAVGRPGTLIGVRDEVAVHEVAVMLDEGDVVVLHTDGATDLPPPHGLDEPAWRTLVHDAVRSGGTADDIAEHIQHALAEILPFESRHDDIALLVLKTA
ncbi:MAG: SpoIIE family protein phosphatase [Ilumatobacteraceae bacterium]|nr:SpoIIE family protein phosphatase [Ilumatobacteraceae bacterium]